MTTTHSIALGFNALNPQQTETCRSIASRAAVAALGVASVAIGIFALVELSGFNYLGPYFGWTAVSVGTLAILGAITVRQIKENTPPNILSSSQKPDLQIGINDCPICFEPLNNAYALNCGHLFHQVCVERWLAMPEYENCCPTCRNPVEDNN